MRSEGGEKNVPNPPHFFRLPCPLSPSPSPSPFTPRPRRLPVNRHTDSQVVPPAQLAPLADFSFRPMTPLGNLITGYNNGYKICWLQNNNADTGCSRGQPNVLKRRVALKSTIAHEKVTRGAIRKLFAHELMAFT